MPPCRPARRQWRIIIIFRPTRDCLPRPTMQSIYKHLVRAILGCARCTFCVRSLVGRRGPAYYFYAMVGCYRLLSSRAGGAFLVDEHVACLFLFPFCSCSADHKRSRSANSKASAMVPHHGVWKETRTLSHPIYSAHMKTGKRIKIFRRLNESLA
jgi:hypothetical protein